VIDDGLDGRVSIPSRGKVFLHCVHTGSGTHTDSYPMGTGGSSLGVKRSAREVEQSPPSSGEFKKGGAISALPHMSSWYSAHLIKHRDNFTF
jgi:hypothetical protein